MVNTLADQLRHDMAFEPGDIQFLHNHQILHARTGFRDSERQRRHLLRLWLSLDDTDGWDLPPNFSFGRYANIDRKMGPVGGILAGTTMTKSVPPGPE